MSLNEDRLCYFSISFLLLLSLLLPYEVGSMLFRLLSTIRCIGNSIWDRITFCTLIFFRLLEIAYGSWYNCCVVQLHSPKFMKFQDLKKLSVPWCTHKLLIGMAKYVLERICFLSNCGYISSISMIGTVLLMYEVRALLFFTKRIVQKLHGMWRLTISSTHFVIQNFQEKVWFEGCLWGCKEVCLFTSKIFPS